MKKYEALLIFLNTLSDEKLEKAIAQTSAEIEKLGGKVSAATRLGRLPFARPIAKKESGIYVQIVFRMEPANINALAERCRHKEDLIRLQVVAAKSALPEQAAAPAKKEIPAAAKAGAG